MALRSQRPPTLRSVSCPMDPSIKVDPPASPTNKPSSRFQKHVSRLTSLMSIMGKSNTIQEHAELAVTPPRERKDTVSRKFGISKGSSLDGSTSDISVQPRTLEVVYPKIKKRAVSMEDVYFGASDNDKELLMGFEPRPVLSFGTLIDGKFSAHILLASFPPHGLITIYVKGTRLDMYWQRQTCKKSSVTRYKPNKVPANQRPVCCNSVELPMYIDSQSAKFQLTDDQTIEVTALTKGYLLIRRKSLSTDNIPAKTRSSKHTSPFVKIINGKIKLQKRSMSHVSLESQE